MEEKMARMLEDEKKKLLEEVKNKSKRKKMLMNQNESETGFENFKRK